MTPLAIKTSAAIVITPDFSQASIGK